MVATFDSQQQLLSYVRWATLENQGDQTGKFEQGSVLAGYRAWKQGAQPLTEDREAEVAHNPSPSML